MFGRFVCTIGVFLTFFGLVDWNVLFVGHVTFEIRLFRSICRFISYCGRGAPIIACLGVGFSILMGALGVWNFPQSVVGRFGLCLGVLACYVGINSLNLTGLRVISIFGGSTLFFGSYILGTYVVCRSYIQVIGGVYVPYVLTCNLPCFFGDNFGPLPHDLASGVVGLIGRNLRLENGLTFVPFGILVCPTFRVFVNVSGA